ncbi:hypothetical protein M595_4513 [Lyngbya aestuarii BL J]|uniref:Uncharacterized protein n=1 Tax=Lyngbya aestuarii BL J TaxID=1348334 RepID=U7QCI8_9CYAN|nr:hypothetical protein [Lyngbya aestuarii]ERT05548.1 hypothetical protein M595_4513 [Lyngbya aestuarii BL J]
MFNRRRLRSLSRILVLPYVVFFLMAIFKYAEKLNKKLDSSYSRRLKTQQKVIVNLFLEYS